MVLFLDRLVLTIELLKDTSAVSCARKKHLNIYHRNQQILPVKSVPLSKLVKFHFKGALSLNNIRSISFRSRKTKYIDLIGESLYTCGQSVTDLADNFL